MTNINLSAVKTLLKKNETKRPILACISYQENRIVFTDSYGLVEIKTQNKQTFNLDVFTGRQLESEYPSVDKIKPRESALESVNEIYIGVKEGVEMYIIDDYPFIRKQVDQTFKTVGLDFNKHVRPEQLEIHKREKHAMLIYRQDELYILVLGTIKGSEVDEEAR